MKKYLVTLTDDEREQLSLRLKQVVGAWEEERNERQVGVNWQFTPAKASTKLNRLYPAPLLC